ncbi:unnamed protein product [Triticum turgidum subsp. durum]|uniref:Glycosyltransferase n=1 Tax=Triticum turgidum subsp. durum TaxID=4567 RepID=A0A9R1PBQ1_TRITD|nr:unnamed protein product [Triticum turgidum subsp. durum]
MLADRKPHAVCVPYPAQGHATPMMKLAKVLHSRGFHITFVYTEHNYRRLVRSRGPGAIAGLPDFRFATIPGVHLLLHNDHLPPPPEEPAWRPQQKRSGDAARDVRRRGQHHELRGGRRGGARRAVPALLDRERVRLHGLLQLPVPGEEKLTNGYLDTPVTNALGMTKHMCLRDFPSFVHTTDQDDILLNFMIHKLGRASRAGAVIDRQHL